MVGRALAFADPDIIRMCSEDFVPVAGDDWYQRRRQDTEGQFFRTLADTAGKRGVGGGTRQGMYMFAADGTYLAYRNGGADPRGMAETMRQALADFKRLPPAKRTAGGIVVAPPAKVDEEFARTPPANGLIVNVYGRVLDFKDGEYRRGTQDQAGGEKAARDHLWLTADEVKQIAPAKTTPGFRYPLPEKVAERICRFHLLDNTRGEPVLWGRGDIRAKRFTLKVVSSAPEGVTLRLEGEAVMASDADVAKAERGFDVRLLGELRYVPTKGTFDKFDVLAVGSHWGETPHAGKARPGKSLLGVSFEIAPDRPSDKVPPQGVRNRDAYYGKD